MAVQDLLSQDEIDALLHGVDDGLVQTESVIEPGSVKSYDLTSQDRIVRGRMPTLEMINERFARYTRISMFNLLRRSADVAVGGVQVMKFGALAVRADQSEPGEDQATARHGLVHSRCQAGVQAGGQLLWWRWPSRQDRRS
jgi:flagellar motor switch protein FliM